MTEVLCLFGLLALLIVIGMPIGLSLGISTTVILATMTKISLNILPQNAFTSLDSFPLMAIPFFIIAGNLMTSGGIAKRLVNTFNELLGWCAGGLAMAATATCMFFAAISGSANATTSAVGSFMIPAMKEKKYDENFAAALCAAAGTIGVIIPPSVPFVVYAVIANCSIGDMFIAGVIPGLLIGFVLMAMCYVVAKKNGYGGTGMKFSLKRFLKTLGDSIWAIMTPVIILGGIYGGIFTPTEAAVVGIVYSLFVGFFIYKTLTFKKLKELTFSAVNSIGGIMTMIFVCMMVANTLVRLKVPQAIIELIFGLTQNKVIILIIINLFLFVVGMIVNDTTGMLICAPLLLPLMKELGISNVHFAAIMGVNLAMGGVTPPYASILYLGMRIGECEFKDIFGPTMKLLIFGYIPVVFLTTYIPALSEWLPTLMGLM